MSSSHISSDNEEATQQVSINDVAHQQPLKEITSKDYDDDEHQRMLDLLAQQKHSNSTYNTNPRIIGGAEHSNIRFNQPNIQVMVQDKLYSQQRMPEKHFSRKGIPDKHFQLQLTPEKHYPQQRIPEKHFPEQRIPEQHYPQQGTPGKHFQEQRIPEQHYPQQGIPEKHFPEQRIPEQHYPQQGIPEKHFQEQRNPEKHFSEQGIPEKHFPDEIIKEEYFHPQRPIEKQTSTTDDNTSYKSDQQTYSHRLLCNIEQRASLNEQNPYNTELQTLSQTRNLEQRKQFTYTPRPMSPLTIDTNSGQQNMMPLPADGRDTGTHSTFYYSPLKSPGIFVPYTDERKREIIENAIREALAKEERFNQDCLQPFPLQDPPKHKLKRQMSTDSNESNDNRTQSYPSKRPQNTDVASERGMHHHPHHRDDRVDASLATTNQNEPEVTCPVKDNEWYCGYKPTDEERAVSRVLNMKDTRDARDTKTIESDVQGIPGLIAKVPEKPYTKNIKWVISSPNPNSVNDFIQAVPNTNQLNRPDNLSDKPVISSSPKKHIDTSLEDMQSTSNTDCHNQSPDLLDKTIVASISPGHLQTSLGNIQSYSERDRTICNAMFSKDFNTHSFERDVKPSSTPSTSGCSWQQSHLKVTEKGFSFPSNHSLKDPILLSPQIVGDRFQPRFESTPRTLESNLHVKKYPLSSPSKRTVPSPTKACCSWQQSPRQQQEIQHDFKYSSQNTSLESDSEIVESSSLQRPTLSSERLSSTISRSTSLSNPNNSISRQRTNGYIQSHMIQPTCNMRYNNGNNHCEITHEDRYINGEMERFFRSYSAVELSPSKNDIENVRDRVRKMYRSISNPSELREVLKNMLIEEIMKEDFSVQNDVFDLSPSKQDKMIHYSPRYQGHPDFYRDHGSNEYQFQRDDSFSHDARRRLFVDPMTQQQSIRSKGKQPMRDHKHVQDGDSDLPSILSEIFKHHSEERHDEEYSGIQNRDDDGFRFHPHDKQIPEGPAQVYNQSCGTGRPTYDCNMPGCSHSNVWYPRDSNRKRKRGDIELCVNCEEDEVSEKSRCLQNALRKVQHSGGKSCSCAKIESAILEMARDAYQKIRRMDSSEHSFDRFTNEATETREQIFNSVKVLCGIKSMCKYGRIIDDIFTGSIVFLINCPTLKSLDHLWNDYLSGELSVLLNEAFLSEKLKMKYNCPTARLHVMISTEDYQRAKDELLPANTTPPKLNTTLSKSDTEIASVCSSSKENYIRDTSARKKVKPSALAIIHMRSQSAPSVNQSPSPSPSRMSPLSNSPFSKDRKFSFSNTGDQSPRKVFQEINTDSPVLNTGSPTVKKVFDFDVSITSKSSPKRKTFGELMPWDNDNVYKETSSPKRKTIRD